MAPTIKALIAQALGFGAATLIVAGGAHFPLFGWAFALVQCTISAVAAASLRSARWWLLIHLAFAPALVAATRLQIAPGWYLCAFVVMVLVYWSSFRTQVPLYLSNRSSAEAVLGLLAPTQPATILDLGSGTGGLLRRLAQARPDCHCVGIEAAPLPLLLSRWPGRAPNLDLRWGNFWDEPLAEYDLVYAFLSPVPMARLWRKVLGEMRPGTLLVSNSFAVPNVAPTRIIEVADRRQTRLYCYRIKPE